MCQKQANAAIRVLRLKAHAFLEAGVAVAWIDFGEAWSFSNSTQGATGGDAPTIKVTAARLPGISRVHE